MLPQKIMKTGFKPTHFWGYLDGRNADTSEDTPPKKRKKRVKK